MHFFYNIGISIYGFFIRIASLFNSKAKSWVNGRKNFFQSLPKVDHENIYWFHCASLGEFDQALPVINKFKELDASVFILVTFFSPSGYDHYNKRKHQVDYACYLPLDSPSNAEKFIKHFQPQKVFFVKYEFWANYIFEAKKAGALLFSISGIFREKQHFFKKGAKFFPEILKQFDYFFVQNKSSLDLLAKIGITNCIVTGDTRFDRVIENKEQLVPNYIINDFKNNKLTFVIGSSWPVDEALIIPLINDKQFDFKFIIAPHDVSEQHIQQIIKTLAVPFIRLSKLKTLDINQRESKVLLIDTIGQLANAYYYGDMAYIGGGFTGKLHNILEPAVFGLPIIFGPKYSRFPEAAFFMDEGVAFSIENQEDLISTVKHIDSQLTDFKTNLIDLINKQQGASDKIVRFVTTQLWNS